MYHNRFGRAFFVTAALCVWSSTTHAQPPTVSADAFVDSAGVNLHLHYFDTVYRNFPLVRSRLIELGVRHVRDGLVDTTWQDYYDRFNALGRAGIKATFITAAHQSNELWASYPARMSQAFEAYEAPNELDKSGDPRWVQTLSQAVVRLRALRSDPRSARFPVLGPALSTAEAYRAFGNASPYFDAGNLHNYMGGRNPGTPGWSHGGYGSIAWSLNNVRPYAGGKPIVTTENGYHGDIPNPDAVPQDVAGRYMPRLLMEQYRAGIARTYIYELLDWPGSGNYGLLNADFSPKPAFRAVKGLLNLLSDSGPAFTPQNLAYSVQGQTDDVRHMVFQKRDGTYFLAIWLEVPSFDHDTRQHVSVAPQSVTVTTATPMRIVGLHRWQGDGSLSSAPVTVTTASIPVEVSDHLTVIQFSPQPSSGVATVPGVPGTLLATVHDRAVHLRWQVPADGGVPAGYTIEAAAAVNPASPITLPVGNVTEIVIPNVAPGVYVARVRAANVHGPGAPTGLVQFAVGVPGAPALAPAHVVGRRVALSWMPGPGAVPSSYVLVVGTSPGAGNVGVFPLGGATSIAADSPITGTLYAHVIAQSSAGAAVSNGISFVVGPPAQLITPTMNPPLVAGSTVRLSWSGGGSASSYLLIARAAPNGPVLASFPVAAQTIDIPGAPRGTFLVSVIARAGQQQSTESNSVTVVVR